MNFVILTFIVEAEPSIDLADMMWLDGVLGDDAKLTATSSHGLRKVWPRGCVDVDDGAVRHDCFPADDTIGSEPFLCTEEGDTALKEISANTHKSCRGQLLLPWAYRTIAHLIAHQQRRHHLVRGR